MRQFNRYFPDEVGFYLISIAGSNYELIDISSAGACVRLNSKTTIHEGESSFDIQIGDAKVTGVLTPAYKAGADKIGLKFLRVSENCSLLKERLDESENTRKATQSTPPFSWKNSEDHLSQAIHDTWYTLIFNLFNEVFHSSVNFFANERFASGLMPITSNSVSSPMGLGSDSLPVKIDLFGYETYLADSMQFHLEYLLRYKQKGVYYIMPTFRGEDPDERHLNQFFHSEAEIVGNMDDVMDLIERYVKHLCNDIVKNHSDLLKEYCGPDLSHIKMLLRDGYSIPRVSFSDACEILGDDPKFYSNLPGGFKTISGEGENVIMKQNNGFFWLTHPPHAVVPFYQAFADDPQFAKSADLCFGLGETIGCGERHADFDSTLKALESHKVDPQDYEWYLKLKKEFPLQTSGFGMGIERFLAFVTKEHDIRNMAIFPRLKGHIYAP